MTHELKTVQPYFEALFVGTKQFEVRRDDRGFQEGDSVHLREWTGSGYTTRSVIATIGYILRDAGDFGVMPGYCVLGLSEMLSVH